jgi:hypothetical protein
MAAADARTALLAQLVILAVFLFAFYDFPSILLRFATSFLAPPRGLCYFLAFNVILISLAWLFHHDTASSSPSFADPSGSPSSSGEAPQHAFQGPPLPPITEAELYGEEAPPEEVVFEDKEAVYVKTVRAQAQPPRRTMSENTRDGAAGRTSTMRAASPELPRVKSQNGRRRKQRRRRWSW